MSQGVSCQSVHDTAPFADLQGADARERICEAFKIIIIVNVKLLLTFTMIHTLIVYNEWAIMSRKNTLIKRIYAIYEIFLSLPKYCDIMVILSALTFDE